MEKKYELTDDYKYVDNNRVKVYRIKALRDFGDVKAGDLGGYVESGANLSQCGDSWVGGNACVYGNARVSGNARVFENATVFGEACVQDNAKVFGNAVVRDTACASDFCQIYDSAKILDDAWIMDKAYIHGCAEVSGYAWVRVFAEVLDNAIITGSALVGDRTRIGGETGLVSGEIKGLGYVFNDNDHCGFDCFGSECRHIHAYRTSVHNIEITCGCFTGTIDEFEAAVHKKHAGNKYEKEYMAIIEAIKAKFDIV